MKKLVCLLVAVLLVGCEGGGSGGIEADNPSLQAIADREAQFLVDTFKIQKPSADLITEKSIDSQGRFYYGSSLVYGVTIGSVIEVSDRYFPNVIRHELLHTAGYNHSDKVINGVTVSDYIDSWTD